MVNRLLLLICIPIVSQVSVAQWHYSVSVTTNGCSYLDKSVAEAQVKYWMGEGYKTFSNKNECEQSRMFVMSQSYTDGSCRVSYIASPCTGPVGMSGNASIFNSNNGSSFYSTNPVDEINDWSNDEMERMLALNPEYKSKESYTIATGDIAFDNLIENIPYSNEAFSGRMPMGSTGLIQSDGQIASVGKTGKGAGVVIPDEYFEGKTFDSGLGKWSSSDLNSVNIDLSSNASMDNSYGIEEQRSLWSNLLGSLDNKLDYYNALEQGDANFLQYMYTRWGKENVMEGIYWWEKNNMSDRISNAFNSIQDAIANTVLHPIDTYNNLRDGAIEKIKDNVDVGVGSTVRFLLPPQYKETGERAQAIYDYGKNRVSDLKKILEEAPDMAAKGKTIDVTKTLEKANNEAQGLAASYGSSEVRKAYKPLKTAADINNLPQEKQKKGLIDMFKKEGKGIVKSEINKSGYYKKMKKNSKKIVDPFNFIFD